MYVRVCVCVGLCVQLSQCCYLTALVLVSGPSLGVEISLSHTHTRTSSPINHKGRGYVGGRGNWGGCPTTMYLHTHTRAYIYTFFPHLPLSPTIFSTTIPPAFPPPSLFSLVSSKHTEKESRVARGKYAAYFKAHVTAPLS